MTMHVSKVKVYFIIAFIGALAFTSTFTSNILSVSATNGPTSNTNQVSARILGSIAIRLLDSSATTEISQLDFAFDGNTSTPGHGSLPTSAGVNLTNTTVVDVATTNPTGYMLYMQSNYQTKDSSGNPTGTYTTNLTHTDTEVSDVIPTLVPSTTPSDPTYGAKVYWNYASYPHGGTAPSIPSTIPAHGSPVMLTQKFTPNNSDKTDVDINVGVDTSIVSGTYENQLLFSAIANPSPVTYNVNFDLDGGTASPAIDNISEDVAAYMDDIVLPSTVPIKTGYTFQQYNIDSITSTYTDPVTGTTTTSTTSTNPPTPATASCIDQSTSQTKSTCAPGDTLRIYSNGEETVTVGLKAIYTLNSYTVSFTNSNTATKNTSGTAISSISVPYGGSATFTITPNSGYYLSAHTCGSLSGYTCSTINTGTSATGQQTVTITNNNTASGGTIAFTGTIATKYMQDQTYIDQCKNASTGTTLTLTDKRDNKEYKVRKLADGKCWMVENLRLTAPSGGKLTSADSNVTSDVAWGTNSGTCSSYTEWCVFDTGSTSYGVYYNYYVATAKTNPSSGNASQSICPRGWKLPSTNGTNTDFQGLYNAYKGSTGAETSTNMRASDGPAFVLSGLRYSGSTYFQGIEGNYWSSTASNSNYAYYLNLASSYVSPAGGYGDKYSGYSVRCVAQ